MKNKYKRAIYTVEFEKEATITVASSAFKIIGVSRNKNKFVLAYENVPHPFAPITYKFRVFHSGDVLPSHYTHVASHEKSFIYMKEVCKKDTTS